MADTERAGPEAVIVIGTPSGGTAYDEYMQTLWRMQFGAQRRYHLIPIQCQGSSIAHNQNNLVKGARAADAELKANGQRGVDAIFFVENDESFRDPEVVIDRLWKSGKDVIGATYCFKDSARIRAMGVELNGDPIDWMSLYHREPLTEVIALPSGALFVRMGVFDALDKEEFTCLSHDGEQMTITEAPHFHHDIHFGLKLVRTTDYVFCCRARKAGFQVWLDASLSLEIDHWGKFPYSFPQPAKINRQIATLQAVADAHAKASEEPDAPSHYRAMAEDLYAIAADMVRRQGAFSVNRDRTPANDEGQAA